MMRKVIAILLILALGILLTSSVAAKSVEVQKLVDSNKEIKVGDGVSVQLVFKNPFNRAIPIQIVDKNVFGNNGLDIQCLEYSLPREAESGIAYEPIVPYKPGMYTLDAAMVTYTNPDTGKEETVNSNTLDLMVEENKSMPSVQAEGITTIYRCGGTNMQSTSYSSSSGTNSQFSSSSSSSSKSFNIQFGGSSFSLGQQQSGSQQGLQKRVDNNQLNQNMEQLKKEMESELQKQQEQQELEEQIQQELAKNTALQKYAEQLTNAGFNSSPPSFNHISQNHTEITVPYRNESAEKKIKADYINGAIQNVTLESTPEQKKEEDNILWWLLLLIIIALVIIGWYASYNKKEPLQEPIPVISKPSVDYVTEARRMVEEAEVLFSNSHEKDAYEKVSQALRFYFARKFGIKKELLNTELNTILCGKGDENTYSDVKECLDLCGMVEFAKYKANKDDFGKIVTMAKAVII